MLTAAAKLARRRIRTTFGCALIAASAASAVARQGASLDAAWRFHLGDVAGVPQWHDAPAEWSPVVLPHTWNALDGADGGNNYVRGTGWYVRHFDVDPTWRGREVFLQFDGANRHAEVFLNGKRIGDHTGGFARFRFDITDALNWTSANVLAVSVSNAPDGTPPISADFTFFGGLYRDVELFATDRVHIDPLDFASDGVYLTQEKVTAAEADLTVKVRLRNDAVQAARVKVRVEVKDHLGTTVATTERDELIGPTSGTVSEQHLAVTHPHRWNGRADPYLYTARVSVAVDGVVRDEISERFGLRSFRVDPEQGFFLNDQHLDLHGVSRHQDRAGKGWAIGATEDREDFNFVKEIGATAIRVAHYPQSDLWFNLADESGLVVWSEIPTVNEIPATTAYSDNAAQQLCELIRQHYNHPSICFWGVGNETRETGDSPGHETVNAPSADRLITKLNEIVHAEDPSRLSVYASHHRGEDVRNFHTDVLGFNKYFGWYGGRPDDLAGWLDNLHQQHPALRLAMSEYGAGANIAQHDDALTPPKPGGPWHPEEYQAYYHERQWQALAARPYVWGKFVWNLFDFASDGRSEGEAPGLNDKGLVTYDRRTRKDAFYWYKANWSSDPMLHIVSRRFVARETKQVEVKIYSNASQVELSVNGVSCGAVSSDNRIFRWKTELAEGENRLVARTKDATHEVTDECVWKFTPPKPGSHSAVTP